LIFDTLNIQTTMVPLLGMHPDIFCILLGIYTETYSIIIFIIMKISNTNFTINNN